MTKTEVFNRLKSKRTGSYGFLSYYSEEVSDDIIRLDIAYCGNMGNTIKSVDNCLVNIGLPTTMELKKMLRQGNEHGDPSYSYSLTIYCDKY